MFAFVRWSPELITVLSKQQKRKSAGVWLHGTGSFEVRIANASMLRPPFQLLVLYFIEAKLMLRKKVPLLRDKF